MKRVGILGAGSWGTAIAAVLIGNGHDVTIWSHREALVDEINQHHTNHTYLRDVTMPEGLRASGSIRDTVSDKDVVFFVVPSHAMREVAVEAREWIRSGTILVSACKGFEPDTGKRMSEILVEEFHDHADVVVLSGPSHAEEVIRRIPTTVVVASEHREARDEIQGLCSNSYFCVYTNADLIGVEVGGALKNIIAIAAGLVDGLGLGDNTKAALITRGLAEMMRLGKAMGAIPVTFIGLAGVGDLVVTCSSRHSRNWRAGYALSQGNDLDTVLRDMGMVVEGVQTTEVAYRLSKKYRVSMPLTEALFRVLFEQEKASGVVDSLMSRGNMDELAEIM